MTTPPAPDFRSSWGFGLSAMAGSAIVAGALAAGSAATHAAPAAPATVPQLADLDLEQLREVRVVTVSRFEERLAQAPASAYVISAEDIRRSGVRTIPEALRLAPNLDVARADANQYAISARGFNNVLANKMLVLIDGRTVYTPLFSGVFWEAQDVVLGDVERIEVVSGPSTALWGSNAVNGLIHIITRTSVETQGSDANVTTGNRQRTVALRHGMRFGDTALRLYAKSYDRTGTRRPDGTAVRDAADGALAGFRADWSAPDQRITLQGDLSRGEVGDGASQRRFSGAALLARMERTDRHGAGLTVQATLDHTERKQPLALEERLDTLDLIAQYAFEPAGAHRWLVGAGHRHSNDRLRQFDAFAFIPGTRRLDWTRLFVQDHVVLSPRLNATLAASVESNPYGGLEFLPSARLAWQIDADRMAWAALSRAARAPSRIDREFFQPAQPPFALAGGPDFESEIATILEAGYRAQAGPNLSYSATVYHHQHHRLRSLAPTPDGLQFRNDIGGSTAGLEAWARWRVSSRWRLDAGLVAQHQRLRVRDGAVDLGGLQALGNDPRHWGSLRSALDLSHGLAWDVSLRRVGARPQPEVPAYTAVDSRLAWQLSPQAEVALAVHNLFDPGHAEWGAANNHAEIERSISLQFRWRH